MQIPRLLISGPSRSVGKTTFTIGLIDSIRKKGLKIQPFKKGPDYIDPMWHTEAAERLCRNLDFHMMSEDAIVASLIRNSKNTDISIIEGNQGLNDGMDIDGTDSSKSLAKLLSAPIIFVVDPSGMNRGVIPLILGFLEFNKDDNIAGIILNKVGSERHNNKIISSIRKYSDIKILGSIPKLDKQKRIKERIMGLRPIKESPILKEKLEIASKIVSENVNIEETIEIAKNAGSLEYPGSYRQEETKRFDMKVGVAKDMAFNFYYPENLEAFEDNGVSLIPFSPIKDEQLPKGVSAIYIGGGFPEFFMRALEKNRSMRESIKREGELGLPILAECGGLLYLSKKMFFNNKEAEMVGLIDGISFMSPKPVGLGYMVLTPTGKCGWYKNDEKLMCHEFHYSELKDLDSSNYCFAWEVQRGKGIFGRLDGLMYKNILASYAHIHHLGARGWIRSFLEHASLINYKT